MHAVSRRFQSSLDDRDFFYLADNCYFFVLLLFFSFFLFS